jgi:choline dehydrogenase-like flavoprotein
MTIINLTEATSNKASTSAEICIIGAGIAGLLMAQRISRSGRKVIVIESGKRQFDAEIHALNNIIDPTAGYSRALTGRYRGLGGTSSRWGGRMVPISTSDTADRPHVQQQGWPLDIAQLNRYGPDIERLFSVSSGSFDEIEGTGAGESQVFLTGEQSLHPRWAKCPSFEKANIFNILEAELSRSATVDIWFEATVCEFGFDRVQGRLDRVVARNFAGKSLEVAATEFVVAAGTIETTRLLLLMDAAADGRIFGRHNVLGHYFQDHLKVEAATINRRTSPAANRRFAYRFIDSTRRDLHLDLAHRAQVDAGAASAFAYIAMDIGNSPLAVVKRIVQGLQRGQVETREFVTVARHVGLVANSAYWRLVRKQLFVPKDVDFKIMLCAEQLPHHDNRLSLDRERDRLGVPMTRIDWRPMPSEELTFRTIIAQLAAYWNATGLARTSPFEWSEAVKQQQTPIIAHAEACAHPSGSTRMGTDPASSVVNPALYCHALPNVGVVSASVLPTAGSANPTFTIMKLACMFAEAYLAKAAHSAPPELVDAFSSDAPRDLGRQR